MGAEATHTVCVATGLFGSRETGWYVYRCAREEGHEGDHECVGIKWKDAYYDALYKDGVELDHRRHPPKGWLPPKTEAGGG